MEELVKWITQNPYLAAAGLIVSILGLLFAIFAFYYNNRNNKNEMKTLINTCEFIARKIEFNLKSKINNKNERKNQVRMLMDAFKKTSDYEYF